MAFQFCRSARVFPWVRLNFSSSGISTTLGVRGASVNVGPRGSHLNLGVPGTGLSFQQPLTHRHGTPGSLAPTTANAPAYLPPKDSIVQPVSVSPIEIKSAANDQITSVSLRELRDLLAEAYQEARRLQSEVPAADRELYTSQNRAYKWGKGHVLKHLFKAKYQTILENFATTQAECKALAEEIEKCRIALEIEMEGGIDTSYGAMVEAFNALAACERCWDNVAARAVDQGRERSSANRSIDRRPVGLDLRPADVIAPSRPALHFQNANGGDLYILPGLLLVLGNQLDFSLIRLTEVRGRHEQVKFFEEEGVPADSKVVGETWAKVNKNGTPDRRFANNHRIPIVQYGLLKFTSAAGLNEEFMFSSDPKTEGFAAAFARHRASLPVD